VSEPPHRAMSGEEQLIARFFRPLASHPGSLDLLDDAALLSPSEGLDLVLTTDALVSGVHFFANDPADAIARKALRVNLSDLAAKGADPAGYLLSLALPDAVGEEWLASFVSGLEADAQSYGCPLLGGDTVKTPGPLMVSITAVGMLPVGTMVKRRGARAGDRVVVTGSVGDSALGLQLRRISDRISQTLGAEERAHLLSRYLLPQPRCAAASAVRRYAAAAMDISDGLAGDLAKLCNASSVSAMCEMGRVPLSEAAQAALAAEPSLLTTILTGGDDYEILAAVPPHKLAAYRDACTDVGVAVTDIGEFTAGTGPPGFLDSEGKRMEFLHPSFSHF
jgi:thiamine-monophosphate kinase